MTRFWQGVAAGWFAAWTLRALWLRWEKYDAVLAAQAALAAATRRRDGWRS